MVNLLWLTRGDESDRVWDTPVAGDGVVEIWVGGVGTTRGGVGTGVDAASCRLFMH